MELANTFLGFDEEPILREIGAGVCVVEGAVGGEVEFGPSCGGLFAEVACVGSVILTGDRVDFALSSFGDEIPPSARDCGPS